MSKFTEIPQVIKVGKFTVSSRIVDDEGDQRAPWEREDGHGEVFGWTTRAKLPGERRLCEDRKAFRYYDYAGAILKAKAEGWDAEPYGTGTAGERAVRAVEADFKRLRDWCRDEWRYVGVILSVSKNGVMLDEYAASLWGIESDCEAYQVDIANDLLSEAVEAGKRQLEKVLS